MAREVTPERNFTPGAQQVLALSRKEAERFNHNFVGTEHVLLGILKLGQGVAVNVLQKRGINLETLRSELEKQVGIGPEQKIVGNTPYTPRVKKVIALAAKEAKAFNHTYVGTEHILLGLLAEGDGVAGRVLKNLQVDVETTRTEVLKELDPNFTPEPSRIVLAPAAAKIPIVEIAGDVIDTRQRYDVYCAERNEMVLYRSVLFKSAKQLFSDEFHQVQGTFVELEDEKGEILFVALSSVIKFRKAEPNTD
jgi:hypothetical protein